VRLDECKRDIPQRCAWRLISVGSFGSYTFQPLVAKTFTAETAATWRTALFGLNLVMDLTAFFCIPQSIKVR